MQLSLFLQVNHLSSYAQGTWLKLDLLLNTDFRLRLLAQASNQVTFGANFLYGLLQRTCEYWEQKQTLMPVQSK